MKRPTSIPTPRLGLLAKLPRPSSPAHPRAPPLVRARPSSLRSPPRPSSSRAPVAHLAQARSLTQTLTAWASLPQPPPRFFARLTQPSLSPPAAPALCSRRGSPLGPDAGAAPSQARGLDGPVRPRLGFAGAWPRRPGAAPARWHGHAASAAPARARGRGIRGAALAGHGTAWPGPLRSLGAAWPGPLHSLGAASCAARGMRPVRPWPRRGARPGAARPLRSPCPGAAPCQRPARPVWHVVCSPGVIRRGARCPRRGPTCCAGCPTRPAIGVLVPPHSLREDRQRSPGVARCGARSAFSHGARPGATWLSARGDLRSPVQRPRGLLVRGMARRGLGARAASLPVARSSHGARGARGQLDPRPMPSVANSASEGRNPLFLLLLSTLFYFCFANRTPMDHVNHLVLFLSRQSHLLAPGIQLMVGVHGSTKFTYVFHDINLVRSVPVMIVS
jgi:hypothetical protein